MPAKPRRRRADAEQNRAAILAVALEALTESADISLNAVAKRAGVANATLYRHFPTREDLILEVYRHEVAQLTQAADDLIARAGPDVALEQWVARLAQYAMTKHGLAGALRAASRNGTELFAETYEPVVAALGRLLVAAAAAGKVRTRTEPGRGDTRAGRTMGTRPRRGLANAGPAAVPTRLRRSTARLNRVDPPSGPAPPCGPARWTRWPAQGCALPAHHIDRSG